MGCFQSQYRWAPRLNSSAKPNQTAIVDADALDGGREETFEP